MRSQVERETVAAATDDVDARSLEMEQVRRELQNRVRLSARLDAMAGTDDEEEDDGAALMLEEIKLRRRRMGICAAGSRWPRARRSRRPAWSRRPRR